MFKSKFDVFKVGSAIVYRYYGNSHVAGQLFPEADH